MSSAVQLAEARVLEVDYWRKVQSGLASMRWYTLFLVASCFLALVITHAVVLSNLNKYLPQVGATYPADQIATVNLTFTAILFLAVASAIYDAKTLFDAISKDIQDKGPLSRFVDPVVMDDIAMYVSSDGNGLFGGSSGMSGGLILKRTARKSTARA